MKNNDLSQPTLPTLQLGMNWLSEDAGGLNRVYYDCIHHLPQVGVEVTGLVAGSQAVAQESGGLVQAFAPLDSSLRQRWLGVRQAVRRLLAQKDYPLVVSHFALYTFPALNQLGSRPLVMHFHGPWALESNMEGSNSFATRLKWMLERITYQRAARFIVLSEAFRDALHREYQVPLERIHVIPSGIDTERFNTTITRSEARAKLNWPPDRPIILAVRRLARRMGLENLIAAMDKVRRQYPDVLLLIAGKGALAETLQAQIEELGLTEQVRLLGFVSDQDLELAYRAADFSVVPTVAWEGFGLIVIESLAAGTPVLGTPIGGIPEILRPFSEDLVFEGTSAEQLAQGIIEALSGQRQLPSSKACEAYIRKHYAWSAIAQRMKSVYQAALDGKTL
jgi:glycosyltransferase involved in cell wall biosynthesis